MQRLWLFRAPHKKKQVILNYVKTSTSAETDNQQSHQQRSARGGCAAALAPQQS